MEDRNCGIKGRKEEAEDGEEGGKEKGEIRKNCILLLSNDASHRLLAFLHLQSCVLTIVTPPGENKLDLLQDFILLTHCKLLLTLLVASRCNFLFLICKSIN